MKRDQIKSEVCKVSLLIVARHGKGLRTLGVTVKVLRVGGVADLGHPWRGYTTVVDHFPVHSVEPLLGLHLVASVASVAQTDAAVGAEE